MLQTILLPLFLIAPVLLNASDLGAKENPSAQTAPSSQLDWNDPDHIQYFRYQIFLTKRNIPAETPDSWRKLARDTRQQKIIQGEIFLRDKFQKIMTKSSMNTNEQDLVAAVWGQEIAAAVTGFHGAPASKEALNQVNALYQRLGGMDVNWDAIFDAQKDQDPAPLPLDPQTELKDQDSFSLPPAPQAESDEKDYLKPEKTLPFLDSLAAPEVQQALVNQQVFAEFLRRHDTATEAIHGMLAMYSVLSRAREPEKTELGHILPTVARLLLDGKKIVLESHPDGSGAFGFAVPGKYDRPEKVAITPEVKNADALIIGEVLAHEFQHIYDMYAGRYYTIDSELRGFKTSALFFRSLKKTSPQKYAELLNSDNDLTRRTMRDAVQYEQAMDEGPRAFYQAVAVGHRYNRWEEGVFMGRMPLREAVDPNFGAPRELAAIKAFRQQTQRDVARLEQRQAEIRIQRDLRPSRELDKELEKVTEDLRIARWTFDQDDADATLKEIRIRRMQSEVEWLDRRSAAKSEKEPFDLNLPVDKNYVVP